MVKLYKATDGNRLAVEANWKNCKSCWHETFPRETLTKNYGFTAGQLRRGLGLLSAQEKRDFQEMRLRGEGMMAIANSMRIPIRVAYFLARQEDGIKKDNGIKPGERLDRLETRLIGELEARTQTIADRRKLSMDEIAMGLKAVRDHRAVDIQRNASGEGKGTSVAVHVASDWMTEEKGPTGEVQ